MLLVVAFLSRNDVTKRNRSWALFDRASPKGCDTSLPSNIQLCLFACVFVCICLFVCISHTFDSHA